MTLKISSIPGVSKFKDIRSKLKKHSSKTYSTRALNKITHIAVHHAASSNTATPYDFAEQHVAKGWPGIGYHIVIARDGTVNWCQNLETISYNVGDNNSYLVGVNMVGNFDKTEPTAAQWTSLYAVVNYLMGQLNVPSSKVLGHKEFPGASTACPGKNVNMDTVRSKLSGGGSSKRDLSLKQNDWSYTNYEATSYDPSLGGPNTEGDPSITGSGTKFTYKRSLAVDWNVIPYGSVVHIYVPGFPQYSGLWLAEDTGADMRNEPNRVDLALTDAKIFGRKQVLLSIVERGTGSADAKAKSKKWDEYLSKYGTGGSGSQDFNLGDGSISGSIDAFELNDPNSAMFRGMSPSVEDDDYPAHRYAGNPFAVRIGDSQFFMPPTSITTERSTSITGTEGLRTKNPLMTKSGYTEEILTLNMLFPGHDNINGFKMKGPDKAEYHMDGLRSLLAQFYKNPFLPIRNEFINDRLEIFNVAFDTISYSTVEGFPNMIVAQIRLIACTVEPFINFPDFIYDRLFNYPLWRWFYQQQLLSKNRYSSTYLKPVPEKMHGKAFFKVLDRDLVEQMKTDVILANEQPHATNKKNDAKFEGKTDSFAWGEYALSRMHIGDIQKLMTDWGTGSAILQEVTVEVKSALSKFVIDDFEKPAYQSLGTIYKGFTMSYYCTSRSQAASFQSLVTHLEEMSREYRFRFVSGFLSIDNEILNLAGIYNAMISNISISTVPGMDDNYIVKLVGHSFDSNQKNDERLNGINYESTENADAFKHAENLDTKMDRKNSIIYEDMVNRVLNSLELYPDLELPTYEVINRAIKGINKFRKANKQSELPYTKLKQPPGAQFVDPDFYFCYPTSKQAYDNLKLGAMGDKIINSLLTGSYSDIEEHADGGSLGLKEGYKLIMDGVQDNSWDVDDGGKRKLEKDKSITFSNLKTDYTTPAGQSWTEDDNPMLPDNKLVEMMTRDMVKYNHRGRMSRAFPTYLFLIVDEGQWVDGRRLWNNYYTYHAIQSIDVVKDKDNPVDLAFVSLNNVYGTFDWENKMTDPRKYAKPVGIKDRLESLWDNWNFSVDDRIVQERSVLMDHAHLKEGARIHIRLGYSSNADDNNIVFNGHIASVNEGEAIQMVCQGDGVELINTPRSTDPKGDSKNEPHNEIQEILTTRTSNYWFSVSADWEFADNYLSEYGIEHFGFVESGTKKDGFKDPSFWSGIIKDHWKVTQTILNDSVPFIAYDVMKNIYKGSQSPVTGQNTGWDPFDGEKNINLSTYNKTPWDVGQSLAAFVPEFIFAAHPHGFRSTLFFGMPHWPVKHGYVRKEGKDGTKYSHYNELVKPFQQFHVLTTGNDIIHNNIKASSEAIKHVAVGIYQFGDNMKTKEAMTVYADRTIMKDRQKTMIVDTGVWQDLFGPDFMISFLGKYGIKPILEIPADVLNGLAAALELLGQDDAAKSLEDWANKYKNALDADAIFTPGQVQARTVAIGALQRNFMEMYQGELLVFGDASLKPWDIFYLNDMHLSMTGTAQVGKVTHSLSLSQGFVSGIKPDLIVSRTDGKGSRASIINTCITLGTAVAMVSTRKVLTSRFVLKMAQLGIPKGVKTGLSAASKNPKISAKDADTRVVRWADKNFGNKAVNWTKDAKFAKKALKLLKGNLFLTVLIGGVSEWLETWFEKETMYNNMIYIYPLWKMGEPFAAGITGGAHIIPGYVDQRYGDPYMTGEGNNRDYTGGDSGVGGSGQVVHPLRQKTTITSNYGPRWGKPHNGTDLAPNGYDKNKKALDTDILAIADGKIIACSNGKGGNNGGMGNYIMLSLEAGGKPYTAVYMHMQNKGFLPGGLKNGSKVKAGQLLGLMGKTGHIVSSSDGTHLHIEISNGATRSSSKIDPVIWFKKQGVSLG